MTVLDTLNFVAFNPLKNSNPIAVRRRKLIAKIDEQIQLAVNKDYTPTHHKWVTDEHGSQRKVEVAKCLSPLELCQYILAKGVRKHGSEAIF